MGALLCTEKLTARYGDAQVLFNIDFEIASSEVVAIIGANGAGKSTFLRSLTGLLPTDVDCVRLDGEPFTRLTPGQIVRRGVAMVPEGRRLFPSLSVEENLLMGGQTKRRGSWTLDRVFDLFPVLRERRHQASTSLSGGQQQMVAIGRALMSNPRLLLCDEVSLGLSPLVVRDIYTALPSIAADGCAIVIVEQDVSLAKQVSARTYCFQQGRVSLHGRSKELTYEQITAAYFGV